MKRFKQISEQIRENIDRFFVEAGEGRFAIDNVLTDMRKRFSEAKTLVAEAVAEERRLAKIYHEAVVIAKRWGENAEEASRNADTELANVARQRQQRQENTANRYKNQLVAQQEIVIRSKTALKEFYEKCQRIKNRAELLNQRQKQAETRAELYKVLAEFNQYDEDAVLEQAEQKLAATETTAAMWEQQNRRTSAQAETTDTDFNIDEALAQLKSDVLGNK